MLRTAQCSFCSCPLLFILATSKILFSVFCYLFLTNPYINILTVQFYLLQLFDGKVGAKFPQYNVFVMSPNMDMIYLPLLNACHVYMHLHRHFEEDDLLRHPQLYSVLHGHLTIISFPAYNTNSSQYILFLFINTSVDFVPLPANPNHSVQLLSHVKLKLQQLLIGKAVALCKYIKAQQIQEKENHPKSTGLKNNTLIKGYKLHLCHLLARLNLSASASEAIMMFALV